MVLETVPRFQFNFLVFCIEISPNIVYNLNIKIVCWLLMKDRVPKAKLIILIFILHHYRQNRREHTW